MLHVPHLDVVLPLVPGELVLVHDSLGDQLLGAGVPRLGSLFAVVPKLGLHGVGAEEHRCLRRAVDLVTEDALLHLEEEELLGDVLDELLNTSSGKNLALNLNWRGFSFLTSWADTWTTKATRSLQVQKTKTHLPKFRFLNRLKKGPLGQFFKR